MEFWGVELKGDKPVKVSPGIDQILHLSQANFAEIKKGGEPVKLYAKVGEQKLVIGVLTGDKFPHISFDLVFEKDFELSHDWKQGSVHLTGYKSLLPDEDDEVFSDFSDDEEALPAEAKQNGVAATKTKPAVAKKEDKSVNNVEDDSDSDESDEDDSDDSDEDDSDEEKEETPVKSGGKKRPAASVAKTPESKKAKLSTPQKTDGKKSAGHLDTPHPAKNSKTPKSGGAVSCDSCKKSFNSQNALDSHSKAKHSAK